MAHGLAWLLGLGLKAQRELGSCPEIHTLCLSPSRAENPSETKGSPK